MASKAKDDSLSRKTVHGLFWSSSGNIVQNILRIFIAAILARLISPADFGIVGAALIVISMLVDFYEVGIGPSIIQIQDLQRAHITTGFTISIVFSLLIFILLVITAPLIAGFFRMPELVSVTRVLAITIPIQGMSVVGLSLLTRELQFRQIAVYKIISYVIGFGLIGITLAVLGFGKWAIVFAQLTQTVCTTILVLFSYRFTMAFGIQRSALREMVYFAGGMSISRVGNQLALQGDNLVVGRQLGDEALGLYNRAYQLMLLPVTLLGQALDSVLFASMSKFQKNNEQLANTFKRGTATLSLFTLPTMTASIILAPELFHVLFGPNWNAAILPFQILTLGMFFRSGYKISDAVARATGAVYKRAWIQWLYAALVILGAFLGKNWGMPGVAFGVLIAITINFIFMSLLSIHLTNLPILTLVKASFRGAGAALIVLFVSVLAITILRELNIIPLAILFITVFLTGGILFVFVYYQPNWVLGTDGIWLIRKIGDSLPERWSNTPLLKIINRRIK